MQSPELSGVKLSFDSVFCYVTDLERSLNFYRNTLELPLVSRDFVARFDIDGVLFELVPAAMDKQVSGSGNARLCLQVQDIHESVAQLRQSGVETSDVKAVTGGLLAFLKILMGTNCACGSTRARGGQCSQKLGEWRRGWDLNPRYPLRYVRFRGGSFQPLTHLSASDDCRYSDLRSFAQSAQDFGSGLPLRSGPLDEPCSLRRLRKNNCTSSAQRPASTPPVTSMRWFSCG
jgi:catechol 2,3-dioxygenase-like lactoylglutathione lyase family enzyme